MPPPIAPLAVAISRLRVEEKWIFAALDRRRVPYRQLDGRQLALELDGKAPPYSGVLNREISRTRGLYLAYLFEAAGLPVINSAAVIEACSDKLRTSLALVSAGVPTPRTSLALTAHAGLTALERLGFPAVIKPLIGSWGRLAAVVRDPEEARTVLEHREALPSPQQHIVYVQELIAKPERDIRVLVVDEEPVAAAYRTGTEWRTNGARGGRFTRCPLGGEVSKFAVAAAAALGRGILAVDLVEGPDGELYVLEVNHTPEFRGLQSAVEGQVDIADVVVRHTLEKVT